MQITVFLACPKFHNSLNEALKVANLKLTLKSKEYMSSIDNGT